MNITNMELREKLKTENINLIDIRDQFQYQNGTIANAINIPVNTLIANYKRYLNKNDKYYIFCNYGSTSSRLCSFLRNNGYDVVNLIGGYQSYKNND